MKHRAPDFIEASLELALSQPPSCVGRCLRPEEQLAGVFHVGRSRFRVAIERLVQRGFLLRKRGSGTYVKRVPPRPVFASGSEPPAVRPELLFKDFSHDPAKDYAGGGQSPRPIRICLWADATWRTITARLITDGIVHRAAELGHTLTVNAAVDVENNPLLVEEIRRRLQSSDAEVHVVFEVLCKQFVAISEGRVPVVGFGSNTLDFHEPSILSDKTEVALRGVRVLRREGCQRIALVALDRRTASKAAEEHDEWSYEMALGPKSQYHASIFLELDDPAAAAKVVQMLEGPHAPDGLLVSDDFLLDVVAEVLADRGLKPGHDIAVVTLSNLGGHPLPKGTNWSRFEWDPQFMGQQLVDMAVRAVQANRRRVNSLAMVAKWIPGSTHTLSRTSPRKQ